MKQTTIYLNIEISNIIICVSLIETWHFTTKRQATAHRSPYVREEHLNPYVINLSRCIISVQGGREVPTHWWDKKVNKMVIIKNIFNLLIS